MSFVRSYNPVWYFVDLQGKQLDDTFYFFPLQNTFPYLPQSVFHDNAGTIPWTSPIQFLPNGTLPEDIFWDPTLVYRLEIRQGNTQADALIYEIDDYVPSTGGSSSTVNGLSNTDNEISNPSFSQVLFDPALTITTAGTYEIAPGWFLKLTGSGTVSTTITQNAVAGTQNFPGNVPYELAFVNAGWSQVLLYQRFSNYSGIWASEAVNASLTGISTGANNLPISFSYAPSNGTQVPIASGNLLTSARTVIGGGVALPASNNSTSGNATYVDFIITLPPIGNFSISNVQLLAGDDSLITPAPAQPIPFIQDSIERQIDHLFHYYNPQLTYKQIKSWLVGWDFPLNPAQPLGSTVAASAIGANASKYVWDQTIIFQSANSGVGVSRGTSGELLLTAAATTQAAVIQYLPQAIARKILNAPISVNISALTSNTNGIGGTVSLYYTKGTLPAINSNLSIVATLDANGKPATFNGSGGNAWIEVPRLTGQNATFTIPQSGSSTNFIDIPLNGWDMQGASDINNATFFAIVVGFQSLPNTKTIGLNSISLCSGKIATRPAPQTLDEVLRECQYYYEMSYDVGTIPGTATGLGQRQAIQRLQFNSGSGNWDGYVLPFETVFTTNKRTATSFIIYSTVTGAANSFDFNIYASLSSSPNATGTQTSGSFFQAVQSSTRTVTDVPGNSASILSSSGLNSSAIVSATLVYQFTADARLGVS